MRAQPEARDEGAVLVMVGLFLTILLGVGALVVDFGALYVEKRELQNGADAAALAVAQGCADGACGAPNVPPQALAEAAAVGNSSDGHAAVPLVCGSGPGLTGCAGAAPAGTAGATGWVKVRTATETSSGGSEVPFLLAPVMGALTGKSVAAEAVAAWGQLSATATLPFIMSECEYLLAGGNLTNGTFPSGTITVYSDPYQSEQCGGQTPGNFGWLDKSNGCFTAILTVGGTTTVGGEPGNNNELKGDCKALFLNPAGIILPLFTTSLGPGQKLIYTVVGFVNFTITAYSLSGDSYPTNSWNCPIPLGENGGAASFRCFQGTFSKAVLDGDFGTGANYGVSVLKMVG